MLSVLLGLFTASTKVCATSAAGGISALVEFGLNSIPTSATVFCICVDLHEKQHIFETLLVTSIMSMAKTSIYKCLEDSVKKYILSPKCYDECAAENCTISNKVDDVTLRRKNVKLNEEEVKSH